ncbi:MAG TPA: hypothetical protein EYP58_05900, partial [bacterium (Candidatus Stahlbacteria)]|nr:hypothetical protein [Candidatus Stahlbacteria bacterium]
MHHNGIKGVVMKMCITILFAVGLTSAAWIPMTSTTARAPSFEVISSEAGATVIEVNVYGIELAEETINGKVYKVVSLPGEESPFDDAVGKPQVPTVPGVIALPDHSIPQAEIIGGSYVDIPDVLLKPFQPPTTDRGEIYPFTIDEQAYKTNSFLPERIVETQHTGYWRDLYVTTVQVKPVVYNPATRTLRVYKDLQVRVSYSGSFPTKIIAPDFATLYKGWIKNYRFLPVVEGRTDDVGCQYLVICNSDYTSTIQPLVDWHHKQGYDVRVISKSSFSYTEIKDSIQNEYNNHTPAKLKWV